MDSERIYKIIDDKIKNCTDEFKRKIHDRLISDFNCDLDLVTQTNIVKHIKKSFQFAESGMHTPDYWRCRGHDENSAIAKSFDIKKGMKKRCTVYNIEYWTSKINPETGLYYTIDEANFNRNSMRPIRMEYWLKRGYSRDDAIRLAQETKNNNNKKGSSTKKSTSINNNKTLEYWIVRGYSVDEAKIIISENQKTFSLDICIEKYGVDDGTARWKARQDKWLNSIELNNDMDIFNKSKCVYKNMIGKDKIEITRFLESLGWNVDYVAVSESEFIEYVSDMIKNNPHYKYCEPSYVFSKIKQYVYYFIGVDNEYLIDLISSSLPFLKNEKFLYQKGAIASYRMYTTEGYFLRSSHEIDFYEMCKYNDIDMIYEGFYNNSSLKYDFYLPKYDLYIEIAGMLNDNEYYRCMLNKQNEFGSIILKPDRMCDFFEDINNGCFDRTNYRLL